MDIRLFNFSNVFLLLILFANDAVPCCDRNRLFFVDLRYRGVGLGILDSLLLALVWARVFAAGGAANSCCSATLALVRDAGPSLLIVVLLATIFANFLSFRTLASFALLFFLLTLLVGTDSFTIADCILLLLFITLLIDGRAVLLLLFILLIDLVMRILSEFVTIGFTLGTDSILLRAGWSSTLGTCVEIVPCALLFIDCGLLLTWCWVSLIIVSKSFICCEVVIPLPFSTFILSANAFISLSA